MQNFPASRHYRNDNKMDTREPSIKLQPAKVAGNEKALIAGVGVGIGGRAKKKEEGPNLVDNRANKIFDGK